MKKQLFAPSLVACCVSATAVSAVDSPDDPMSNFSSGKEVQAGGSCSLYLAPSSSSGEATDDGSSGYFKDPHNIGIFAGTDLPPGSRVGYSDIVIPITDVRAHVEYYNKRRQRELQERDAIDPTTGHHSMDWHLSDFVWEPRHFGAVVGEGVDTKAAAPGLGTLVRGNAAMANVVHSRVSYDASGLHRSKDPSVGSFSYYHDMTTITTKPIKAGEELYEDFGEHYYSDREGLIGVPPYADFGPKDFFSKYQHIMEDHADLLDANRGGVMDSLWGVIHDSPLQPSLQKILPKFWKRDAVEELADSVVSGGHSTQWLETNGRCLDNIRPGKSTVPEAGRGALATRPLAAGSIIGPAPVIHIPDRSLLEVREPHYGEDGEFGIMSDMVIGSQLLLNYCFGHNKSTMLLCNAGVGTSYINHAPPGVEPNAKLQWSENAILHNTTWLGMSPDDLDKDRNIGLMLEYVALTDIQPGEEILIDYGQEWEQAWKEHLKTWKALPGAEDYVDAGVLNDKSVNVPVRTLKEQQSDPYPTTIETSCYYKYIPGADEETDDLTQIRMVTRRWLNGMDAKGTNLRPCRILRRGKNELGSEEYTVRILNSDETHHDLRIPDKERLIVTNIPRQAIIFTNRMYSTDMHLPDAFRHEMILPDELFPVAWKNLL